MPAAFTLALTALTIGLFRITEPDLAMVLLFVAAALFAAVIVVSNRAASDKAVPRFFGQTQRFHLVERYTFPRRRGPDDRSGLRYRYLPAQSTDYRRLILVCSWCG